VLLADKYVMIDFVLPSTASLPTCLLLSNFCPKNNPLHISIFPAEGEKEERSKLDFSFMLSTCLDIFEARLPEKNVGQDFGLLQAIDERLAMYGWLTNTGVKLVIIVDMEARQSSANDTRTPPVLGLKNSDLTPVSSAMRLT
jgi:hypothetical protein